MKRKILDIIALLAFVFVIGTVGAYENGAIDFVQCLTRSVLSALVGLCAFLSN